MAETQLWSHNDSMTHDGFCMHMKDVSPDCIVMVCSNMWDKHGGIMIGRFADIPWDALKHWLTYEQSFMCWYELRTGVIN